MDLAARIVGYGVIGGAAIAAVAFLMLLAWAVFPIRYDLSRRTPSLLKTPGGVFAIDLLAGISSRRKVKWFFGLLIVSPGQEPVIVTPAKDPTS